MYSKAVKTITIMLVVIFTLSTAAFAADFTDVPSNNWAKAYIDKMNLKGVINGLGGGKFGPDQNLTRAQAVTMLVRILGYSDSSISDDKAIPNSLQNPAAVPDWAKKFVAVGVEKGIIAGSDLENFRPNDPAKRWEVAVFAVRALGLAAEAESRSNVNLSFTDTYLIPLSARSFVEVAVEKGVIKGMGDGTFKPMDSLTRAQAAAMFTRVDDLLQNDLDANEIRGTIVGVDDSALPSVTLRLSNGSQRIITVNNATAVYREYNVARLQDLKVGDAAVVLMNDTATYALLVSATEEGLPVPTANTTVVNGSIKSIDSKTRFISILTADGDTDSYIIPQDAVVTVDDLTARIQDLTVGQMVEIGVLKSDPNTVVTVKATGVDETVKGEVTFVYNQADNQFITIKDADGDSQNYSVSSNVVVTRDGKSVRLEGLRNGDVAELKISSSRVVEITAEPSEKSLSGSLREISYSGANPVITVEDSDDEYEYPVDDKADIERNRRSAKLSDLRVGDDVDVLLEYDFDEEEFYVTEITAKSVDRDITGTFKGFGVSDNITITITNDDTGKDETFILSSDARIRKDGSRIYPQDINIGFQGYYVELEVESDVIVRMDLTTRNTKEFITGIIEAVNEKNMIISLKNWTYNTAKIVTDEERAILVTDDTKYMRGSNTTRLRNLNVGDEITAFGKTQGGIFTAELVVIMND